MKDATRECALVAPYLTAREGELSPEERRLVDAHLPGCELCGGIARELAASDGLVAEALLAAAARRDFSPFVDRVMDRTYGAAAARAEPGRAPASPPGLLERLVGWVRAHRRAAAATALAPTLAAAVALLYLSSAGGPPPPHAGEVEVVAEGSVPMVLQTSEGPVVLLGDPEPGT
jgi:anti-sigma factor RsiW